MPQISAKGQSMPESPIRKNKASRFVCPTCNYEFPSKQRLEKHMRQTDHGEYSDMG